MSKNVFLFAGQGAQFPGMGKDFYEKFDIAKEYFDTADKVVPGLKKVCFEGPEEELKLTKYCQPGVFTLSAAIDSILKEKGIKPEAVAGFSLGEYTALYSAGVFDFNTGIEIVKVRGESMTKACDANPGGMAAIIGLEDDVVEEICREVSSEGEVVVPVNYNCPGQIVVSGTRPGVQRVVEISEEKEAKHAVVLKVYGAFHSSLMKPAEEGLRAAIENAELKNPAIPVVMNVNAEEVTDLEKIKELMLKQLTSPVLWKQSVGLFIDKGYKDYAELGPGNVLKGFMRRIIRGTDLTINTDNFQKVEDLENLKSLKD